MHQNHSMDEQICIVVESFLSIELTLMLVSTTVFLQQLSNTIEGFLSFVSLQTEHEKMIAFPIRLCPIVRAKKSADTYHDIVSCCTKEAYSLASFLTIFGNVLAFLYSSLVDQSV
ncbi:hypothetical protein [Marinococcus halophilus]|uniref:hypothetical protein n=1 Tax=Marinococcus halophilus TaxID=1371 RepID=UPI00117F02C6|nr:hypothetical protein [Marinococcus halophilus]